MDDDSCPICRNPSEVREQIGCAFINPKRAGCPHFDINNQPVTVRRPMPGDGGKSRTVILGPMRVIPVPQRIEDPEDVIVFRPTGSLLGVGDSVISSGALLKRPTIGPSKKRSSLSCNDTFATCRRAKA